MGVRLKILASDESIEDLEIWQRCEAFDCITAPTGSNGAVYDRIQNLWRDRANVYVFGAKAREEQDFLIGPQPITAELLERVMRLSADSVPLRRFLAETKRKNIVGYYDA